MVHFSISLILQRRDLGKVQQERDLFLARTDIFEAKSWVSPENGRTPPLVQAQVSPKLEDVMW